MIKCVSWLGIKELYIKRYGNSYEIASLNEKELKELFYEICRKNEIICKPTSALDL